MAEELSIYQYGFEIIFSTILGFLITIGIGLLLHMGWLSVLYYVIFVFLRQCTGGYHADSYLKCNLIFAMVSFLTMGMTQLSMHNVQYTFIFHLLLIGLALSVIWLYSPVENEYKPLDEMQKKKNHIVGFLFALLLSLLSCLFFWRATKISILIALTLLMISMLIVIEKIKKRGEENEQG